MRSLNKLIKLEEQLNIDRPEPKILILDCWANFIEKGIFKDAAEQQTFLDWRIAKFREELKKTGNPIEIYGFSKEDVDKHLPEFKKATKK